MFCLDSPVSLRKQHQMRRRKGFTLVELLVVIGIIALLVAMLLPALNKARRAAKTVLCGSNLRQCALGLQLYAHDNGGNIPIYKSNAGAVQMWAYFLMLGYNTNEQPTGKTYVQNNAALCPETIGYDELTNLSNTNPILGVRSYGIFVADPVSSLPVFRDFLLKKNLGPTWDFYYSKVTRLQTPPTETILLADSLRDPAALPPLSQCGAFRDQDYGPRNAGCIHTPHSNGMGMANVTFFDGHVDLLSPRQLRKGTASQIKRIWDRQCKQVDLSVLYP
jgi:prepilin-type N-terminal cleavage/methylation domain-containing protein/prepilin-type processing-associated H-X9-DG protein